MPTFEAGDIVRVEYNSPRYIEQWMNGQRPVGPGDIGVVKYSVNEYLSMDTFNATYTNGGWHGNVTVLFPMIGTFAVHSSQLRIVQKAGAGEAATGG